MRDFDWQIILTLFHEKNISRAAEILFITQPTLTKRLQRIEEELNTSITVRSTKGVVFTPEGEYIAFKAKEILDLIEETKLFISRSNGGKNGLLRIGASNSYLNFVLPSLIKNYSISHPEIRFDISCALSHEVLQMAEEEVIDVGFVRGDVNTTLEHLLISSDQIHIVSKGPIAFQDLPYLPFIDYMKEPTIVKATRTWWYQYFKSPPHLMMRVNHGDICRRMILQGLGYGIFSDLNFIEDSDKLTCTPLFFKDGRKFTRDTWFVYRKESLKKPIIQTFVHFIQDQIKTSE